MLIPKKLLPGTFADFRPILLSNFWAMIISKMMANKLKRVLPDLISSNQSAFIKNRKISDNLLLCHEKARDFHKVGGTERMIVKINLKKAFDSVDRNALVEYSF